MSDNPVHLAERAAQRLKAVSPPGIASLLKEGSGAAPQRALNLATPANFPLMHPSQPVVGRDALERAGLVGSVDGRSRISQEFSILQSELLNQFGEAGLDGRGAIIMVTSARPKEGKTFVALNLAGSMAHNTPRDILLVDTDSKDGNLSSLLGLADRPGLLDLADGSNSSAKGFAAETNIDRLTILPIGRAQPGSGALHGVTSAAAIIEALRSNFPNRVIVLDVAACLASSDSATLAPFVEHALVVVQAKQTKQAELAGTIELLRGCPHLSLMLNQTDISPAASFGDYHS